MLLRSDDAADPTAGNDWKTSVLVAPGAAGFAREHGFSTTILDVGSVKVHHSIL